MLSRSLRFGFVAVITAAAVALPACEGCDTATPQQRPVLVARTPNGTTVDADGQSLVAIQITALGADGLPDVSPITVTPDKGAVGVSGGNLVEGALTESPNNQGVLALDYRCAANEIGQVNIGIANASAEATVRISCQEPGGAILINIDDAECDDLQADAESSCTVRFTVLRDAPQDIPQAGTVNVEVVGTTGASGDTDKIAPDLDQQPQSSLALELLPDGSQSFAFFTGTEEETVTVEINFGGTTRTVTIDVDEFNDRSDLILSGNQQVIGGDPSSLTIEARGANGGPAAAPHDTVDIVITGGDGSATVTAGGQTGATLTDVALDANGRVTATVNTPVVDEPTEFTVQVSYAYLSDPAFEPRVETITITALEQGALILDVVADPTSIRSDLPDQRVTELEVTFKKDNARVAGGTVTLSIGQGDSTRIRFLCGTLTVCGPTQVVLSETDFDAVTGVRVVEVTAEPNVAPGLARVAIVGDDAGERVTAEVTISVERAPILQSIVALQPEPSIIGVRGGALASSSQVSFRLLDDANNPMPNVPVTFEKNDTADPGISVTATAVSNAAGIVSTILSAGTIAGPVTVIVTAQPVSPDPLVQLASLTVSSPPINIVGGLPNFLESFMVCDPAIERLEGEQFSCSAFIVDRFQNFVVAQQVQFKAEGSGTQTVATTNNNGIAAANLILDDGDTASTASLPGWSYGNVPLASDLPGFAGCFDATVTTACNVLDLCAASEINCPLPNLGANCLARAQGAAALLEGGLRDTDPNLEAYLDDHRACGFPVSCLLGAVAFAGGVPSFEGDECPVAIGCMDYSNGTECPHDELMTVTASTRGEESFVDGNGNGVLDFDDADGDGVMDATEQFSTRPERCDFGFCELGRNACVNATQCTQRVPIDSFVDLPEPFLDKNNSCSRDDLTNAPHYRFQPTLKTKHSDLFSDVDGNLLFGFSVGADGLVERNGIYDADTEIFQTAHVLTVNPPIGIVGGPCDLGDLGCTEHVTPSGVIGIDPFNIPAQIRKTDPTIPLRYRFADAFGNCPSPGFAGIVDVTTTGPIEIVGDVVLELDALNCGFASGTNALVPHCQDLPLLGSPVGFLGVVENCGTTADDTLATVEFSLDNAVEVITFDVLCSEVIP